MDFHPILNHLICIFQWPPNWPSCFHPWHLHSLISTLQPEGSFKNVKQIITPMLQTSDNFSSYLEEKLKSYYGLQVIQTSMFSLTSFLTSFSPYLLLFSHTGFLAFLGTSQASHLRAFAISSAWNVLTPGFHMACFHTSKSLFKCNFP